MNELFSSYLVFKVHNREIDLSKLNQTTQVISSQLYKEPFLFQSSSDAYQLADFECLPTISQYRFTFVHRISFISSVLLQSVR